MKKSLSVFLVVISVILTFAVTASAGLSFMTYQKVAALEAAAAEEAPEDGVEGEDNITIGGNYVIRSTKAISDAYISGDSSGLSERDKETLDMASEILSDIITDGMSDYDKEKAVFEWMNQNIGGSSDVTVLVREDNSDDNPHGVLAARSAVCVGYATTFRMFMQMLGIPCMVVHNTDFVHSWDLVQIDGHWYHVDLYSAQNTGGPLQYLNRDDGLMSGSGYQWSTSFYPAADSLERSYIYENAIKAKDVYEIPDAVKTAIEDRAGFASVLLPAGDNVRELSDALLYSLEEKLMNSVEYQNISISHGVSKTPDGDILAYVSIYDYSENEDDTEDDQISDDDRERIDSAISDSFGELTEITYDYSDDIYYSEY